MGTATFIKEWIRESRNPENTKGYLKNLKSMWENADDTSRRSLHRTAVEIAFTNVMALTALVLMGLSDDDREKNGDNASWALQFSSYMGLRTSNEVISSTTAFLPEVASFLQNPVVGLDKLQQVGNILDLGSSEEVKQGRFRGYSERERFIYKSLPLARETFSLREIERTKSSYSFYNKSNLEFPFVWSTYLLSQDDEK